MNAELFVPTRGQIQWQTVERLTDIVLSHDVPPVNWVQGTLSVAQTRNRAVRLFLKHSQADIMVMVDDDIVPPMNMLNLLLADDVPVEMGPVALPCLMWEPTNGCYLSVYDDAVGGIRPRGLDAGLNMVDVAGTGCMALHRKWLEDYMPLNPFRFSREPGEEGLSEDVIFCRDARQAGLSVMAIWDGSYCDHAKLMGLDSLMQLEQRLVA